MGLQLTVPIATARGILNDADAARYSAADLLQYANDALDQLVVLVPQEFQATMNHVCVAGALQILPLATALALVSVNRVTGAGAIHPTDKDTLDRYDPAWQFGTAGAAANWMPFVNDPRRFYLSPPSAVAQSVEVTYIAVPAEYALTADTGLPTNYGDAITDYVVYRAESRDDEFVVSARAQAFMQSFVTKVKGE